MDVDGLCDLLRRLAPYFPGVAGMANTVQSSVVFAGTIHVAKKLPIGSVQLAIDVFAIPSGALELDIKSATWFGWDAFGQVRKKAGDTIIGAVNELAWARCVKAPNGNLWLSVPGVLFERIVITDQIVVEVEIA